MKRHFNALSDKKIAETLAAIEECRKQGIYSDRAIGKKLGISRTTMQNRREAIRLAAESGYLGTRPVLPGFVINRTSAQLDKDGQVQREWVQQKKEAGDQFEVPDGHSVKGISALIDGENRIVAQWIKTRNDDAIPGLVEALRSTFDAYRGRSELIDAPSHVDDDLCSIYPIADQHHGMLAWGKEAGEDYDLKIGADRLRSCMRRLISQAPPSGQAIILNLGDWQHTDDGTNATPRSRHILDVDSRYFKILQTGVRLMMDCIELALAKHARVLVRNLPGNHDPHASIALTVALGAFYSNNPRVTIDDDPSEFFYYRFGATLLGANHGHKTKPQQMAMHMAVTRREDWGATLFHLFLFAHVHHESAKEVGDVRVESIQPLSSKDAHAASSGYTSGQSLLSITLHVTEGEIGRHRVNMAPKLDRAA